MSKGKGAIVDVDIDERWEGAPVEADTCQKWEGAPSGSNGRMHVYILTDMSNGKMYQ